MIRISAGMASVLFVASFAQAQPVVYVRSSAPAGGDGSSWATAYNNLGTALAAAPADAEIWVSAGTYTTTNGFAIPAGRLLLGGFIGTETFREQRVPSSNMTTLSGSNSSTVVLFNASPAGTIVDGFGITNGLSMISGQRGGGVMVQGGSPTLRNCAIYNCVGTIADSGNARFQGIGGGGIYIGGAATPRIEDCTFRANSGASAQVCLCSFDLSAGEGGGAYVTESSAPVFVHCTFVSNHAGAASGNCFAGTWQSLPGANGGGLRVVGASLTLDRCVLDSNSSSPGIDSFATCATHFAVPSQRGGNGGGIYATNSNVTARECTFLRNSGPNGGNGAVGGFGASSGAPGGSGGAIYSDGGTLTLNNCRLIANIAGNGGNGVDGLGGPPPAPQSSPGASAGQGGAIYTTNTSVTLAGCLLSSNVAGSAGRGGQFPTPAPDGAPGQGAGVFTSGGLVVVRNCTFANNTSFGTTSALVSQAGDVANTIFYFNTGAGVQSQLAQTNATSVQYTCMQNLGSGLTGPGNIASDPLFMDPDGPDNIAGNADDDYSLRSASPCIDRGSNALVPPLLTLDLAARPRRSDIREVADLGSGSPPVVDMGAFEVQGLPPCLWWTAASGSPGARRLSAMAYDDSRHRAVLFGGRSGATVFSDVWERDTDGIWTRAAPNLGSPARADHTMTYVADFGATLCFGGYDSTQTLSNDMLMWRGSGWTSVAQTSARPTARGSHAIAYNSARHELVLFGGYDSNLLLGDTWVFDIQSGAWTPYPAVNPHPSPRLGHMMAYDESRSTVVLFGGGSSTGAFGDTWEWNGIAWNQVAVGGAPTPVGRSYGSLSYDSARRTVVLHGGLPGGSAPLSDTWEWNGHAWNQLFLNPPPARGLAASCFDSARTAVVLFGGYNGSSDLADAWELAPPSRCCVADVDDGSGHGTPDGGVTIDDLLYYLGLFEAGVVRADIDDGTGTGTPDGGVTIDDLLYFLARYGVGC